MMFNTVYNYNEYFTIIVILYNCSGLAGECSSCLSVSNTLMVNCGWCLYDKKCTSSSNQCRVVTDWINVSSTSIVSEMY